MLTSTGKTLVTGGCIILVTALLLGNAPLAAAGAIPLLLAATASPPRPVHAARTMSATRIERGGHVDITLEARIPRGIGIVEIHQALPDEFELVEGNNLQVETQGWRERTLRHTLRVRAPKRGEYALPPPTVRVTHPLGIAAIPATTVGETLTLNVLPRPSAARIPRDLRTRARRPYPEGDAARDGLEGDDFKELREYAPGDSAKRINWKATARHLASNVNARPLVNEVEREGKKSVWILVDGHPRLSAGTNIEDARELAADAALSLAEAYLRRNHAVGLSLARSGDVRAEAPQTGEAQVRRLRGTLSRLASEQRPSLIEVLERDAALLHRARPLLIVVTRLTGDDPDLEAAIRRISALTHGRGLTPGLIIDVRVHDPEQKPENVLDRTARAVLEREREHLTAVARAGGLRVVSWRARKEPFARIMTRERIA